MQFTPIILSVSARLRWLLTLVNHAEIRWLIGLSASALLGSLVVIVCAAVERLDETLIERLNLAGTHYWSVEIIDATLALGVMWAILCGIVRLSPGPLGDALRRVLRSGRRPRTPRRIRQ